MTWAPDVSPDRLRYLRERAASSGPQTSSAVVVSVNELAALLQALDEQDRSHRLAVLRAGGVLRPRPVR